MRIKNVRKSRPKSPTRGAQTKRQRRQSPSSGPGDQVHSNNPDDPQEPSTVTASDASATVQRETWSMILARIADQPFTSQVQQYKDWRRTGSAHDNQCCICHKPELLEPCHTCRLAFHPECLPHGWARNSYNQLFCSICVARGWDRSPPVLTPPASPQPSQAQLPAVNVTAPPSQHLPSQTPAPESRPEGLGGIPINQSPTHGAQVAELAGQNSTPTPGSHAANSDRIANTATPEPKRRQRKSRYSTLPSEVDLSLATIYRELESVASLRTEVEDLRNESAQQNQTIRIHEQNQIVMRRELEALRANATNSESVNKELSELRKRNASLEAELQISREQTAAAKELKERLAQLLNN